MGKLIPFNVPFVPEASKKYMLEALESNHQQGDGPFTAKACKMVSDLVGGGHVLLTPSCTHALEMASMLANIGPGDEVILPSYTFTSAATAVTKFGATPVFVDVEMETKGIDVNQVREAITHRTKAISWVNYAGVAPDIDGLQTLANEFNLLLIEDNAHGLGGSFKGKPLGSFGDFATQSFHATKNIQCGEGGALVVNNPRFIERAEIIREKGTNRSKFIRGEIQKYEWVDQGSSYLLADSLSAILLGQLENFSEIQATRRKVWKDYSERLGNLSGDKASFTFFEETGDVAHMFYLQFSSDEEAKNFNQLSNKLGVKTSFHYQSLSASKMAMINLGVKDSSGNSKKIAKRLIRLPLHTKIQMSEIVLVSNVVKRFLGQVEENFSGI